MAGQEVARLVQIPTSLQLVTMAASHPSAGQEGGQEGGQVAGQEGVDNAAFEPDSRVQFISAPESSQPPAPAAKPTEPEKKDPPADPPAE